MDDPGLDPETKEKVEEFRRFMDASSLFCNRAIVMMARDRMFRDWEARNRPVVPEPGLARKAGKALAGFIKHQLSSHQKKPTIPKVIIVEPNITPPHRNFKSGRISRYLEGEDPYGK